MSYPGGRAARGHSIRDMDARKLPRGEAMNIPGAPDYQVGGPVITHDSIDIRLFEGEAIINREGRVVAWVEDGKLVRPKDRVFVMTREIWRQLKGEKNERTSEASSLVEGDNGSR